MGGALQVTIASSCDLFPESTDLTDLLGPGVSPIAMATWASCIDDRIDDFNEKGTPCDTLDLTESDEEVILAEDAI